MYPIEKISNIYNTLKGIYIWFYMSKLILAGKNWNIKIVIERKKYITFTWWFRNFYDIFIIVIELFSSSFCLSCSSPASTISVWVTFGWIFLSFHAAITATRMKSRISQTVSIEAPSNKPRNPPTYENRKRFR